VSDQSRLPLGERAKIYRAHAREARIKAAQCKGEVQAAFIKLAGQWEQLAVEAEEESKAP
jgi:hypothetical protein